MELNIIKKENDFSNWSSFGIYIPWPDFGTSHIGDFRENETHYGIELSTRIKLIKTFGFLRFDFRILGFGFYYCRQWNY
ncbi:MAG: hypothetical protein ACTSU6_00930 [Candidatus Njordarchaeales archaeon]